MEEKHEDHEIISKNVEQTECTKCIKMLHVVKNTSTVCTHDVLMMYKILVFNLFMYKTIIKMLSVVKSALYHEKY